MGDSVGDPVPAAAPRGVLVGIPLLVGAAVSVAVGVFGRVHTPTGVALWIGPFPSLIAMKVWLTVIVLALALAQFVSALWIYGRFGARPARWINGLHRGLGALAVLVSLPVAANCLWVLGFQTTSSRVLAHGLLGCAFYGAFVAKLLTLHSRRLPNWALPVVAGLLLTAVVGVSLTSAVWYLATEGAPH